MNKIKMKNKYLNLFLVVIIFASIQAVYSKKIQADTGTIGWTEDTSAAPWSTRSGFGAVVFNNKMWVMGGVGISGGVYNDGSFNDVWSSSDGVNWTKATSAAAWTPRHDFGAVVFNNKMWVIGGVNQNLLITDVWSSSDGVNWTEATSSPAWLASHYYGRAGFGAVVFNNKMWVMGGSTAGVGSNYGVVGYNDVWSSSDGVNWTLDAMAPWKARFGFGAVVFNNKMWVIGGEKPHYDAAGNYMGNGPINYTDVWSSSDGVNWTEATSAAPWLWRFYFGAVVFNNQMWVMGGYWGYNDVWSSSDGVNWTEATSAAPWSGRVSLGSVVFNNQMWVMGGRLNGNYFQLLNDVWSSHPINLASTLKVTTNLPTSGGNINQLFGSLPYTSWKFNFVNITDPCSVANCANVTNATYTPLSVNGSSGTMIWHPDSANGGNPPTGYTRTLSKGGPTAMNRLERFFASAIHTANADDCGVSNTCTINTFNSGGTYSYAANYTYDSANQCTIKVSAALNGSNANANGLAYTITAGGQSYSGTFNGSSSQTITTSAPTSSANPASYVITTQPMTYSANGHSYATDGNQPDGTWQESEQCPAGGTAIFTPTLQTRASLQVK